MTALSLCDFGPAPRPPARFNLAAHTLPCAAPGKTALTVIGDGGAVLERLTHGEIRAAALAAAGGLAARGITRGDRVALRIGHSTDFPIMFLGAAALGAVPVPTSTQLSIDEIDYILRDTEARLLICSDGLELPGHGAALLHPDEIAGDPLDDFAATKADELGYIVYTSGSSGHPKGVAHAHRAAFARRMMWDGWYGLGEDDILLHAGAFNWTYTLGAGLMDPWAAGASSLIYAGARDAGVWAGIARDHHATIFAATPGVFRQLLRSGADLSGLAALRHALSAGEALQDDLRGDWTARTGRPIHEALGMTECSTFISASPAHPHRAGTCGRPQPGRCVALLPPEDGDAPVALGESGIIAIRRDDPGLMLGYWRAPEETAAVMRGDWFVTGDLGAMDADGFITYQGRIDDQMNALGYRVAPQEVEAALNLHPHIAASAAVDLPVRADLSVIAAFIVSDEPLDDDALRAHCAEHLALYKIPKRFTRIDALPQSPNGKLKRRALVEAYGFRSGS